MTTWAPLIAAVVTTLINLLMSFGNYISKRDGQLKVDSANSTAAQLRTDEHFARVDSAVKILWEKVDGIIQDIVKVQTEGEYREATNQRDHQRYERQLDQLFKSMHHNHPDE